MKEGIQPHSRDAELRSAFSQAYEFLTRCGTVRLRTSVGTEFEARAATSSGKKFMRFFQAGKEYARAYECCWGHYYNCNRTRIGMYRKALDEAIQARS